MVLEETRKDLIEACQRGESGAFHALFDRYKDKVYTIALRYSGDPHEAQDIAQEAFLKLLSGIAGFRGSARFESWLFRLVVNACFDRKRRSRRLLPMIDGLLDFIRAPGESVLDEVLKAEMSGQLRTVIAGLPPKQRMLVVLRYSQNLSYEEIAEILGCSAGTVASRLNRVHKLLEQRLLRVSGSTRRNRV